MADLLPGNTTTVLAPPTTGAMWDHQTRAVQFAENRPGVVLDIGMGGGKSRTAVEIASAMGARTVLVLCPKSLIGMWPAMFNGPLTVAGHEDGWHPDRWDTWSGQVMGARGPKASATVAEKAVAGIQAHTTAIKLGQPFLTVVNYEAAQKQMQAWLEGVKWDLVIMDESHRCKSPGGVAATAAARIAHRCRARGGKALLLTGTFMPHSELDVWAQMLAVDSGKRLDTNVHRFRQRFAEAEEYRKPGGNVAIKYVGIREDRRAEFSALLSQVVYSVTQEYLDAALDLPEAVDIVRTCTLGGASRRAYDDMAADLIAEIDGSEAVAANAMVLTTRLAQLSGGFCKTPDGQVVYAAQPPEKAVLLGEILDDIDPATPVVVFARFTADLAAIKAAAEKAGRRYGELSGQRRDGLTTDGKLAPGVQVLGVQYQAGGVGVDLSASPVCVFYSLDFRLSDHLQARKRVHRPGQSQRVTYVYLLAEETLDRAVLGALRNRRDAIEVAMTHIRNHNTRSTA